MGSRSRTPGSPGAPPQIPASGVTASGSYLGSKRTTAAAPIRSSVLCRSCRIWDREPLALSQPPVLPSTLPPVWAPRSYAFHGSIPGPHLLPPTLAQHGRPHSAMDCPGAGTFLRECASQPSGFRHIGYLDYRDNCSEQKGARPETLNTYRPIGRAHYFSCFLAPEGR